MFRGFLLFFVATGVCAAQDLSLPETASQDFAALSREVAPLASKVIDLYRDDDRARYLATLLPLQVAAGRFAEVQRTLLELRTLHSDPASRQARTMHIEYEIYVRAKAQEPGLPFERALRHVFREVIGPLDDRSAALAMRMLVAAQYPVGISLHLPIDENLSAALARQKGKTSISLNNAVDLIRAYALKQIYSSFSAVLPALIAEDDNRRYVIEQNVLVRTPAAGHVCALIVRPRTSVKLPTLLNFTIYADSAVVMSEARRSASNGYVGVAGFTRGKACSPDEPVPYEHDGTDGAALIDWIAAQRWSDSRVGMFGASYEGFTQWAVAKHMPKALKALMPSVSAAPGIDTPPDGGIFESDAYPWPFYTTNGKELDPVTYGDRERWSRLFLTWYKSGASYRSLGKIDGVPNRFFDRWLDHPTYDAYWQRLTPVGLAFARIDIPVLATTGYYDGAQIGALHYFRNHYRYLRTAEHYLVIGPYDHATGNRGTINVLGDSLPVLSGYQLDSAAFLDIGQLRYEWFDYNFKGGQKPSLLKDKVNYQVMGANVWKHAPSIEAMSALPIDLHLSSAQSGTDGYRLSDSFASDAFIQQRIDLADRTDAERVAPQGSVLDHQIDSLNGLRFVSEPFAAPVETSGLFRGHLDFIINKKDFDFRVELYELSAVGDYLKLASYMARASHIADLSRRHLLRPNERQQLDFQSKRLMSRRLASGSRLVVVLSINRHPYAQINYGTGKDVSDETIADAAVPLEIKWFESSTVSIPVGR